MSLVNNRIKHNTQKDLYVIKIYVHLKQVLFLLHTYRNSYPGNKRFDHLVHKRNLYSLLFYKTVRIPHDPRSRQLLSVLTGTYSV